MAQITAADVSKLRKMTGAGMMDCKKALEESNGDFEKAVEVIRKKGQLIASKRADREASEGVVIAKSSADGKSGAMIVLNCETDFVAKNEDFLAFANGLAQLVATANPSDLGALASLELDGTTVENKRQSLVQKIGENISVRRFERVQAASRLSLYLHGAKIGVIVDCEGPEEVGKDLAMHIAFARPRYLAKSDVPADLVAHERDIVAARAKESGKPPEIAARMVEGGVNKFLGEITLLGQAFVKDDKQSVEKMLSSKKAKVHGYRFLVVGEGIEKKSSDFVAEVQAQAGMAR